MADDLKIEHTFAAPVKKVWEAWSDPEMIKCWWGPKDFTAPFATMDLKVGGKYLFCMRGPDGIDYWSGGEIMELKPMERIVFSDSFMDKDGNIIPASAYGMQDDFPDKLTVTLTFAEKGPNATVFTLTHAGMPDGKTRDLAKQGWEESLDKLEKCLNC